MVQVTQILDCCRELGQQAGEVYQPKLLFCVVQKRHHTRLFAANERDADKTGNLPAGGACVHAWPVACCPQRQHWDAAADVSWGQQVARRTTPSDRTVCFSKTASLSLGVAARHASRSLTSSAHRCNQDDHTAVHVALDSYLSIRGRELKARRVGSQSAIICSPAFSAHSPDCVHASQQSPSSLWLRRHGAGPHGHPPHGEQLLPDQPCGAERHQPAHPLPRAVRHPGHAPGRVPAVHQQVRVSAFFVCCSNFFGVKGCGCHVPCAWQASAPGMCGWPCMVHAGALSRCCWCWENAWQACVVVIDSWPPQLQLAGCMGCHSRTAMLGSGEHLITAVRAPGYW